MLAFWIWLAQAAWFESSASVYITRFLSRDDAIACPTNEVHIVFPVDVNPLAGCRQYMSCAMQVQYIHMVALAVLDTQHVHDTARCHVHSHQRMYYGRGH